MTNKHLANKSMKTPAEAYEAGFLCGVQAQEMNIYRASICMELFPFTDERGSKFGHPLFAEFKRGWMESKSE